MEQNTPKKKRGFAAMSPEKRQEIARKGGQKVHQLGKGYHFPKGTVAREAGRKGGLAAHAARQADSVETIPPPQDLQDTTTSASAAE